MYSYGIFMISGCTFKSLIHFELTFQYFVSSDPVSFFFIWLSNFPNTFYWRGILSNILVYSWLLCHKLIDHIIWVHFQGLYFVPVIYVSVFMTVSYCLLVGFFLYHIVLIITALQNSLKSGRVMPLALFCLKITLAI